MASSLPQGSLSVTQLLLTSSVLAAALGAVAGQSMTWIRESLSVKRERDYLALRLATCFERYAEDAAYFLTVLQAFETGREDGVTVQLPVLAPLPGDHERWRNLHVRLTSRIFGFEEHRRSRQVDVDDTWRHGEPHEAVEAARVYSIVLGREAFQLGVDLRRRHGLPVFDTTSHWPELLAGEYDALPEHWKDHVNGN